MARIRSVKPEFWADEDLAQVSRDARLLYIGLWNLADEYGRLRGGPRYILGQLFPYDDDLSGAEISALLKDLADIGKVVLYQSEGSSYLYLPTLHRHQRLDQRVGSRLPEPPPQIYPDSSAQVAGESEEVQTETDETDNMQVRGAPQIYPDSSAQLQMSADKKALLYVACSMEHVTSSCPDSDEPRPDVERLCQHLADRIEANGSKRPSVTKAWRDSARLMLDKDGRDPGKVIRAIDWCQDDNFWKGNILSMPKLREKYDQLRLAAERSSPAKAPLPPGVGRFHTQ